MKVDKFILPADFVVLDMEEDGEISLILERPFLATGPVLIDVEKEKLALTINDEHVLFSIFKAMQFQDDKEHCNFIDNIQLCVNEHIEHTLSSNTLEYGTINSCEPCSSIIELNDVDLYDYVHDLDSMQEEKNKVNIREFMVITGLKEEIEKENE